MISLKFGTLIKLIEAYIFLKFLGILIKIEGAMYYDIVIFSQFVAAPTKCTVNAMDLKIFPNIIVLLQVDCFKGFSNWSSIDKLVISSMSGGNCKNYKLNNSNYKLKIA